MKKLLVLLLTGAMAIGASALAYAEDDAGFDEFPIGASDGEEKDVDFMTMSMVYFQPVDMAPEESATPKEGSDCHIEVDLTANENPYSFPVDGWVPYLSIDFVITDNETGEKVTEGSMMPMAASDGPHYGNNIALAEGSYTITLSIKSPAENGYLLHIDPETGVEADSFWDEPLTAVWDEFEFVKEW